MNHLFFFLFPFLIVSSLLASQSTQCCYFNGPYIGCSGGTAINMADTIIDVSTNYPSATEDEPEAIFTESKNNIYSYRPCGEIFLGWGYLCSRFYMGGRFGINFSSFDLKTAPTITRTDPDDEGNFDFDNSVKTKMRTVEYTFDFKPGLIINPQTMCFALLGTSINKERLQGNSRFSFVGFEDAFSEISFQKSKMSAGFRAGLGVEEMITPCLSLQVNYVYTRYWRLKKSAVQQFGDEPFFHRVTFSTKARKQVATIGLSYYF